MTLLALFRHLLGDDRLLETLLGLLVEVEVTEASIRTASIVPGYLEVRHKLVGKAKTSTRVGRQVNARDTKLASELCALVEKVVLLRSEGTDLVGDVVGNHNHATTVGVLRGASTEHPAHHTAAVGAGFAVDLLKVVLVIENKLGKSKTVTNLGLRSVESRLVLDGLCPAVLNGLAEELGEIVNVLRSHEMSLVTLRLEPVLGRVRSVHRQKVHRSLLPRTADAVENPLATLGLALSIHVNIGNVA